MMKFRNEKASITWASWHIPFEMARTRAISHSTPQVHAIRTVSENAPSRGDEIVLVSRFTRSGHPEDPKNSCDVIGNDSTK